MARWQYKGNKDEMSDFGVMLTNGESYLFEITAVENKETSSDRMMSLLTLKVVDGPDNVGQKARGRHNVIQIPEGEPGHGMALQFLKAIGWPYDGDLDFDTDDFVGEQFAATVKHEEYEYDGEDRTKNGYSPYLVEEDGVESTASDPASDPDPELKKDEPKKAPKGNPGTTAASKGAGKGAKKKKKSKKKF